MNLDEIEARWAERHREWTTEATSDIMALIQYARNLKANVDDACREACRDERKRAADYIAKSIHDVPVYQSSYGPKELRARSRALENAAWGVSHNAHGKRWEEDDD
jgi:hypothetical protein